MLRTALKTLFVIAALGILAPEAEAFGHRGRWGGCGWGYGGGGYRGCGYGGWGYGGYGSWGYGGYTGLGYSGLGYGGTGGIPLAGATQLPASGAATSSALLVVNVPADAKVFVNDRPTSSTGAQREYISHNMQPGGRYNFKVRAEFERDGKPVVEEKTVALTANQRDTLDLNPGAEVQTAAGSDLRTTLVVHVPEDAKVFLAGLETKSKGPVRQFVTTQLTADSQWTSYPIRVVFNQDGQEQVRETTVTLKAGETREMTINLDDEQLAGSRIRTGLQ